LINLYIFIFIIINSLTHYDTIGGSGNYFRPLAKELEKENISVFAYSLPSKAPKGRVYSDVTDIVNQLFDSILLNEDIKKVPVVFLGHSLGGICAFELSRKLEGTLNLKALILSAVRNPILLTSSNQDSNIVKRHCANDKDFIAYFKSIGGLPDGMDKDMLQLSMSWIRDDYKAFETYQIKEFSKVSCPLFVMGGHSDPSVFPTTLDGWFDFSHNHLFDVSNEATIFSGSHFYLTEDSGKNLFKEKLISICKTDFMPRIDNTLECLEKIHISEESSSHYCIAKNDGSVFLTDIDADEHKCVSIEETSHLRRDRDTCYSFIEKKVFQPV